MTSSIPTPGAMPKPGPRPTPGAMPSTATTPSANPAVPVVPAHTPPANDPAKFGRVAADGTVYVTTTAGERVIGQWQAGTPEEGLAHYGKRFENLAAEVELLEARLKAHPGEAESIQKNAAELRASLPTAAVIGDLAALDQRLDDVIKHSAQAGAQAEADKARRREDALAAKEKLAAEAEDLAENSTNWKQAGDRIRAILEEWKQIRGIDRKTDDALWKRYSRARDAFNRRRGAHFAELDRSRATARATKEQLVARAEQLKVSTDWKETAHAFRDLMAEWKAAGRAPREVDEKLWTAFRAAQDHFFAARNAVDDERDKEFTQNAAAKDALLAEYDALIDPSKSLEGAKAKLRELQEKWEEIGFVPRHQVSEYEDKIGALEQRVADAVNAEWRRTDPAVQARVAQFQAKVADLQAQAAAADAKGNAKKAEELRSQAAQWEQWAQAAAAAVDDQ